VYLKLKKQFIFEKAQERRRKK